MVLATWAAKTAMTAEYVRPRADGISGSERKILMNHLVPPEHWYVWIAGYDDAYWKNLAIYQNRGQLQSGTVAGPTGRKHYIHSTTFGVGIDGDVIDPCQ